MRVALATLLLASCHPAVNAPVDAGRDAGSIHPDGGAALPDAGVSVDAVLGRPARTSVGVSLLSTADVEAYVEYGVTPGAYTDRTAASARTARVPFTESLSGLQPDTRYAYRVRWRPAGATEFLASQEHAFHTARPAGTPFTFTLQADPHLDDKSDLQLYQRALDNQLADGADFMIDLGDTFMCEKFSGPFTATVMPAADEATVVARYAFEHGNFSRVAHSLPLFLVNGNHEGEAGWLFSGTDSLAAWATRARKAFFAVPYPDGFFTGETTEQPVVGRRAAWYAWEWGDVLLIVLDPFWYTTARNKTDGWTWTLGEEQHRWLETTLRESGATFRLVFLHNLLGGVDTQARGGVEGATLYEWGGRNTDGTEGFSAHRPGWSSPVHALLVDHHVNAVFHGHDHLYARQELDGVVYQEVPQPSAPNYGSGPVLAAEGQYESGIIQGSAGHLRVSATAAEVRVEYVRAYRDQDETGQRHNRDVSDSYVLLPR